VVGERAGLAPGQGSGLRVAVVDFSDAPTPPVPAGVQRSVLSWHEPLPRSAARWLAQGWNPQQVLDLSAWLVVVPTRQSGRRLREALAALAAESGQAVFPPRVLLPESLATLTLPPTVGLATRAEHQLAWLEVLQTIELDSFPEVFPVAPPSRSFTWARGLAAQLMRLQVTLAESGLRIAGVVELAGSDPAGFPEQSRWRQLAELEARVDALLSAKGRVSAEAAAIASAAQFVLPPGISRIALLATPDPSPLALQVLRACAAELPVEVVIYGPPDEAEGQILFDEWGRPRADAWAERSLDWADFSERVHLCADPASQAAQVVELARTYPRPEGLLGIGVADPDVLSSLEPALARAGVVAFNPAGRPRRAEGLYALLTALSDLARAATWDASAALLRCPDVMEWLTRKEGPGFSAARLLAEIDHLAESHLPPNLSVAVRQAANHPTDYATALAALVGLERLRAQLVSGTFPGNAAEVLQLLFAGRRLDTSSRLYESADAWTDTAREVGRALAAFPRVGRTLGDAWEFALGQFGERPRFAEKPAGALELNGWLELLWEDAPHLVVAGLNDGRVPEAVVGDAFLPESLRAKVGLKTNATRFARDAYLLHALAASRTEQGRLDVLVGKVSAQGDPLRPSRLLLRCRDEYLPARVDWLFRDVSAPQASVPWTRAWTLSPRRLPPRTSVSVTSLRTWLACPFRYYMRHVLRMNRVEPSKAELDARDFGTLMHAALQRLADEEVRDCTDAAILQTFLLGRFEEAARATYGDLLTLPLMIQFESARQRLRKAAEIQARERADGWRIDRVEWQFELALAGLTVRGTIDRIDRRVDDPGRVRLLDYKTSDTSVTAPEAHLRAARDADVERDPWQRLTSDRKERIWIDLQLPLYRQAMAAEFGDSVVCGYFNLPKAAGDAAIELWDGLTRDLQAAAERCAEGVAEAIVAGRFGPPTEVDGDRDDWAELFHHGCAASVDPAWREGSA